MPISPQQIAPPIDSVKLEQFYQVVDGQLQNAQVVSAAILQSGNEHYKDDAFGLVLTIPGHRLNKSEQEKLAKDYLLAGWKECRVLEDGMDPGKGAFSIVLLRSILQARPK